MCPSYANARNIGEISGETSAMTLPVNADLTHIWQAVCHASLILYSVVTKLKLITLLEEY